MMGTRSKEIRFLFIIILILLTGRVFSQNTEIESENDTSDYIPFFYRGALDYNLMIAASHGNLKEVNRMILKGADIYAETDKGATALIYAISNDCTDVAKALIDYGADPNKLTSGGETPFFIAVKHQNVKVAEALIRAGIDIDNTDRYDATALHYAAAYDYPDIADMLIYYEASIDKKTIEGSTPLMAAVFAGNADIADLLIKNGANLESTDNEGYTPFQIAALNGDTLIMDMLLKNKANIYAVNNLKHNALTISIIGNQPDALKYLLRIGDKWAEKGNQALDPYVVASKYSRKEMINILREHNISGNYSYKIDQVDIMLSTRFTDHDILTGMSFSFREPYLDAGIIVGLDTKLWYTRVLTKQSENLFYQYWDKGSVIYAGLFKNFALTDNAFKGNFEFSASLSAGYGFANDVRGTFSDPKNKVLVIPAASLKWSKKDLSFNMGVEYTKTGFYHAGPIWLRLGCSYNLYFDKVRTRPKTLKTLRWY